MSSIQMAFPGMDSYDTYTTEKIIYGKESETLEHKKSLGEEKDAIEALAAFATAKGGAVCFGIDDDGTIKGCDIGKNSIENLANQIKLCTQPSLYPSIEVREVESKKIVIVQVYQSPVKPVFAYNIAFKRVGKTNQKISREEIRNLIEQSSDKTWDALLNPECTLSDVSPDRIFTYLQLSGQNTSTTPLFVLDNLYFTKNGNIANGAVLLFHNNPQKIFPSATVECALFKGTNSVNFLDRQTISGDIINQIQQSLVFVNRSIRKEYIITEAAERKEVDAYPGEAIREAVINAICHRDYSARGNIQIRIYSDRLEIWNPGMLPPDLSVTDLYKEHQSMPRNPRIADSLFRVKMIEKFGTGTLRIVDACKKAGLPSPEFISEMGSFKVVFKAPIIDRLNQITGGRIYFVIQKIGDDKFNRLISEFREKEKLSTREVANILDFSIPKARSILGELENMGVVQMESTSKTDPHAGWVLLLGEVGQE